MKSQKLLSMSHYILLGGLLLICQTNLFAQTSNLSGRLLLIGSDEYATNVYIHDFDQTTTGILVADVLIGRISPDHQQLAYSRHVSDTEQELRVMDLYGGNDFHVVNISGDSSGQLELVGWTPSGQRLIFRRQNTTCHNELYSVLLDGTDEQLFLDPAIANGTDQSMYGACFDADYQTITWASQSGCWSPSLELYQADMIGDVIDPTTVVQLTNNSVYEDIGRSGAVVNGKIAFWRSVGHPYTGSAHEIFVMDADGSNAVQITSNDYADNRAVFSPDGNYLVWASKASGDYDIVGVMMDEYVEFPILTSADREEPIAWLPDATTVAIEDDDDNVVVSLLTSSLTAYPNPFNPATNISFVVQEPGRVKLCVYDVAGRLVDTLVDAYMSVGEKAESWRGTDAEGHSVSSGLYFLRLETRHVIDNRKILLTK